MSYKSSHSVHQVSACLGLGYFLTVLALIATLQAVQHGMPSSPKSHNPIISVESVFRSNEI